MTAFGTRAFAGVGAIALSAGLLVTAAAPTTAAEPRITAKQCSQETPPQNGYVIVDPTTNTSCTVNKNGTFLQVRGTTIKKNQRVKVRAGMCPATTRGDVRRYATVYYTRGKTVIKTRVRLGPSCGVATAQKLTKRGKWAIVVKYRKTSISTTVKVK